LPLDVVTNIQVNNWSGPSVLHSILCDDHIAMALEANPIRIQDDLIDVGATHHELTI